ncbi:hypothetical protein GUJ93_ZPchr0010g8773 [Zizania palustris]|uniref:Uncharacterized protein n=1 Tax=Zizania palustris TaxID=103762 RepID=A0A8J5WC32_ZIZPA|nr:hypothetical protein GUJ93_ZPchr0010g8773 [Zizania palustris]
MAKAYKVAVTPTSEAEDLRQALHALKDEVTKLRAEASKSRSEAKDLRPKNEALKAERVKDTTEIFQNESLTKGEGTDARYLIVGEFSGAQEVVPELKDFTMVLTLALKLLEEIFFP